MTASTLHPRAELALTYRNAAKVVQARGHAKGLYETVTGEVCTVGALLLAEGRDPQFGLMPGVRLSPAIWFLSALVESNTTDLDPIERIADWNDAAERTAAEVVQVLLDAALAIEAREAGALVPTSVLLAAEVSR